MQQTTFSEARALVLEAMRKVGDGKMSAADATAVSRLSNAFVMNVDSERKLRKAAGLPEWGDILGLPATPASRTRGAPR